MATTPKRPTPRPRGPVFVAAVHEAVIDVLAIRGYASLSIPEIAQRVGANKTSLYRRWPTKADLVRSAVGASLAGATPVRSTGRLRDDMLDVARSAARFVRSPLGTGAIRMLLAEGESTEVRALVGALLDGRETGGPRDLLESARAEGRLAAGTDTRLVLSTIAGALLHRLLVERRPLTDAYLRKLIDLLLGGCRGAPGVTGGRPAGPPRSKRPPKGTEVT